MESCGRFPREFREEKELERLGCQRRRVVAWRPPLASRAPPKNTKRWHGLPRSQTNTSRRRIACRDSISTTSPDDLCFFVVHREVPGLHSIVDRRESAETMGGRQNPFAPVPARWWPYLIVLAARAAVCESGAWMPKNAFRPIDDYDLISQKTGNRGTSGIKGLVEPPRESVR